MTNNTTDAAPRAPLPLDGALRSAETELARLRGRIRTVTEFIHDEAYDLDGRRALALSLGLPAPSQALMPANRNGATPVIEIARACALYPLAAYQITNCLLRAALTTAARQAPALLSFPARPLREEATSA